MSQLRNAARHVTKRRKMSFSYGQSKLTYVFVIRWISRISIMQGRYSLNERVWRNHNTSSINALTMDVEWMDGR